MAKKERVVLELTTDDSGLNKGLGDAGKSLQGFKAAALTVSKDLKSFGVAAANVGTDLTKYVSLPVTALAGSLIALAKHTSAVGNEIAKSAKEAGLSGQAFQELTFAVGQIGRVSDEEASKALNKLTIAIGEAAKGSGTAKDALYQLGFSQAEIASGTIKTEDAFMRLTTAMGASKSEATAAALAGDLVGDRLGPKLAGPLRASAGEVDRLRDQFKALGLGMSQEALDASEEFEDSLDLLQRQFSALTLEIGSKVMPILTQQLIPWIRDHVLPTFRALADRVIELIKWFSDLPGPIQLLIVALGGTAAAAGPVLLVFGQLASAAGNVAALIAKLNISVAALGWGLVSLSSVVAAVAGAFALWKVSSLAQDFVAARAGMQSFEQQLQGLGIRALSVGEQFTAAGLMIANYLNQGSLTHDAIVAIIIGRRKAIEDATAVVNDATSRNTQAQAVLRQQLVDLAAQIGNLSAAGITGSKAVELLGAEAKSASDRAKVLGLSLGEIPPSVQALAAAAATSGLRLGQTLTEIAKSAKDLKKQIDEDRTALEALGLVTAGQVNRSLEEFERLLAAAKAEGVPFPAVVAAMLPKLEELAAGAKRSGIQVRDLTAAITEARGILGTPLFNIPVNQDTGAILTQSMIKFNLEATKAAIDAAALTRAYGYFGLTTRAELNASAKAARDAYATIARSGTATAAELTAARERVLEAERAAAGKTISIWQGQIWPAVRDVAKSITGVLSDGLSQVLVGATSFKDAFVGIWHEIRSALASIFSQILKYFLDTVITGILNALRGQSGSFSQAFSAFTGGGGGGGGLGAGKGVNWGALGGAAGNSYAAGGISGAANSLYPGSVATGVPWGQLLGGGAMAITGGIGLAKAWQSGSKLGGAVSGAQTGAGIGTMIMPGIGTAIGAGVGALVGFVGALFKKEGAKTNDIRDKWMDAKGGSDAARNLIGSFGNDPQLAAAFGKLYFAKNRDVFAEGAAAFDQRLEQLRGQLDSAIGVGTIDAMVTGQPAWATRLEAAIRESVPNYSGAKVEFNVGGHKVGEVLFEDIIKRFEDNAGGGAPVSPVTRMRTALGVPQQAGVTA